MKFRPYKADITINGETKDTITYWSAADPMTKRNKSDAGLAYYDEHKDEIESENNTVKDIQITNIKALKYSDIIK